MSRRNSPPVCRGSWPCLGGEAHLFVRAGVLGGGTRHGSGALFLLVYGGGLAGLYSLRPDWVTPAGVRERLMRLKLGAGG